MDSFESRLDYMKSLVFNIISTKGTKIKPAKTKDICFECNITPRELKRVVSELRNDYPIVSKETEEGGYWIATSEKEIIDFIKMIERRKKGYETTIKIMNIYLADYGNIPYID